MARQLVYFYYMYIIFGNIYKVPGTMYVHILMVKKKHKNNQIPCYC